MIFSFFLEHLPSLRLCNYLRDPSLHLCPPLLPPQCKAHPPNPTQVSLLPAPPIPHHHCRHLGLVTIGP